MGYNLIVSYPDQNKETTTEFDNANAAIDAMSNQAYIFLKTDLRKKTGRRMTLELTNAQEDQVEKEETPEP